MKPIIKIGTRESELAVWQATQVQNLLKKNSIDSELVYIKSEGDVDTVTPLYELGVQGIFTKTLGSRKAFCFLLCLISRNRDLASIYRMLM